MASEAYLSLVVSDMVSCLTRSCLSVLPALLQCDKELLVLAVNMLLPSVLSLHERLGRQQIESVWYSTGLSTLSKDGLGVSLGVFTWQRVRIWVCYT